jgi:hypothetical protein
MDSAAKETIGKVHEMSVRIYSPFVKTCRASDHEATPRRSSGRHYWGTLLHARGLNRKRWPWKEETVPLWLRATARARASGRPCAPLRGRRTETLALESLKCAGQVSTNCRRRTCTFGHQVGWQPGGSGVTALATGERRVQGWLSEQRNNALRRSNERRGLRAGELA